MLRIEGLGLAEPEKGQSVTSNIATTETRCICLICQFWATRRMETIFVSFCICSEYVPDRIGVQIWIEKKQKKQKNIYKPIFQKVKELTEIRKNLFSFPLLIVTGEKRNWNKITLYSNSHKQRFWGLLL